MGDKTGISWTDATWAPARGCSRISEGCRNCYAERIAARFSGPGQAFHGFAQVVAPRDLLDRTGGRHNGWTRKVEFQPSQLAVPLHWKKPRRIFCSSMTDIFHEELSNEQVAAIFGVMAACPQHTFQVLTKRAKRMREWFEWIAKQDGGGFETAVLHVEAGPHIEDAIGDPNDQYGDDRATKACEVLLDAGWPLRNVWIGVSVENQEAADERIPELLRTPAAVRFLSCEPLIGPVNLRRVRPSPMPIDSLTGGWGVDSNNDAHHKQDGRIGWVVAGCESGPGARVCEVEWLRSLRAQCSDTGTAFFLKQAVAKIEHVQHSSGGSYPHAAIMAADGSKTKAGGVIELPYMDGVQSRAFPKVNNAA